ncbi:MAG: NAD(+) kinase [Acidiferrobacterales bacterium]
MKAKFQHIGLFGKFGDPGVAGDIDRLAKFLSLRGHELAIEQETASTLENPVAPPYRYDEIGNHIDLAIVIGGDGTLLHVARKMAGHDIPLIGINLGRLGFLTDIPADKMEQALGHILDGEYDLEERAMLSAEVMRGGKIVHTANAFNDVIIGKGELSRLIEFETYQDGEFVNSMRADGVIVATPTGSTAYALSAGGPILHPNLGAIVIVPICPHTLSDRPIVVSSDSVIEVVLTGGNQNVHATFDGQEMFSLNDNDHVFIRRAEKPVRLIHPSGRSHYDVLRAKLHWGEKF